MIKELYNKITTYVDALFHGMKAADEIITTSNNSIGDGVGVHQTTTKKNVLNDLLRGEVTQEVEELRWETYKTVEEAEGYTYIGNGVSIKNDSLTEGKKVQLRKKFRQQNQTLDYSLAESMHIIENNDADKVSFAERKLISIEYENPNVRFRIENHCSFIDIDIRNEKHLITKLYFVRDKMAKKVVPLVNEIIKTKNTIDLCKGNSDSLKFIYSMNELCSGFKKLSLMTHNASNNVPDGIEYTFLEGELEDIDVSGKEYVVLTYNWKDFNGNVLLSERFHSESAKKKFDNKEARAGFVVDYDKIKSGEQAF